MPLTRGSSSDPLPPTHPLIVPARMVPTPRLKPNTSPPSLPSHSLSMLPSSSASTAYSHTPTLGGGIYPMSGGLGGAPRDHSLLGILPASLPLTAAGVGSTRSIVRSNTHTSSSSLPSSGSSSFLPMSNQTLARLSNTSLTASAVQPVSPREVLISSLSRAPSFYSHTNSSSSTPGVSRSSRRRSRNRPG